MNADPTVKDGGGVDGFLTRWISGWNPYDPSKL